MADVLMERIGRAALEPAGSRKSIADFLLREGTGVKVLSMGEVADLTYTSKASLVRFSQAMGFSGWRDFRLAFVRMMEMRETMRDKAAPDPNHPFSKEASLKEVIASVTELKRGAVMDAAAAIDEEMLAEAARRVLAARTTVFFGAPPNCYFGRLFAYKMHQIGVFCQVPEEERWAEVAPRLDERDCALIVSYSGVGPERLPVSLLTTFDRAKVPVISVTNSGRNWLREHSDCVLSFAPRERYYTKISGYYSESCISLILDVLFSACFIVSYERNEVLNRRMLVELERRRARRVEDVLPD